jgi:hypothetical protein
MPSPLHARSVEVCTALGSLVWLCCAKMPEELTYDQHLEVREQRCDRLADLLKVDRRHVRSLVDAGDWGAIVQRINDWFNELRDRPTWEWFDSAE